MAFLPCLFLVARFEQVGVDGIGNIGNGLSFQQFTLFGHSFQPTAACHECDVCPVKKLSFFLESAIGKVFLSSFE